jgi:DNA polymerase-3 subunit delta'
VPWLLPAWDLLREARGADRLAHALLLAGPQGVGKRWFADLLARALLCAVPDTDGVACGRCAECHLTLAGSHPDLIRVGPDPESKSGEIGVDRVRDLLQRASLTAARAPLKAIILDPADQLSVSAANALLKTLEEPPGPAVLILIAEQAGRLPATIRSRCQLVKLALPDREMALAWLAARPDRLTDPEARLALGRGAPLRALFAMDDTTLARHRELRDGLLALAAGERDPVREADAWNALGAPLSLDWLGGWLCDLARLAATGPLAEPRVSGESPDFLPLAARLDGVGLHRLIQRVLEARALMATTVNPLLMLESLLIDWCRLTQPMHPSTQRP